jgi:5'-3' exonuclease
MIKELMLQNGTLQRIIECTKKGEEGVLNAMYVNCRKQVSERLKKLAQATNSLTPDEIILATQVLILSGAKVVQLNGEAEEYGCWFTNHDVLDAVLSRDCDCLAYGAKIWISDIDIRSNTVITIDYDSLYKLYDFDREQFVRYCTLLGTDYSERIPKYGPVKVYDIVKSGKLIGYPTKEERAKGEKWCKEHYLEVSEEVKSA